MSQPKRSTASSSNLADHRFHRNITVRHIHTHIYQPLNHPDSTYTTSARLRIILNSENIISVTFYPPNPMSCHRTVRQDNADQDHPVIATKHTSPPLSSVPPSSPLCTCMYVCTERMVRVSSCEPAYDLPRTGYPGIAFPSQPMHLHPSRRHITS